MGVRSFLGWLRRTLNDTRCSCHFEAGDASCAVEWETVALYVDLNGIVHKCGRESGDVEHIAKQLMLELLGICEKFRPSSVYIAVDGSPPLAKIEQQLERRVQSRTRRERKSHNGLDSTMITPGTQFMGSLHEFLKGIACALLQHDSLCIEEVIVSPAHEPGEAEYKCFEYVRSVSSGSRDMLHVVVGDDTDLIAMGLNAVGQHVHVYRPSSRRVYCCSAIRDVLMCLCCESACAHALPVAQHGSSTDADLAASPPYRSSPLNDEAVQLVMMDLLLLCALIGNDYLPPFYCADWESLWESYMQLRRDTSKGVVKVLDGMVCLDTAQFSALLSMLPYNDIELCVEEQGADTATYIRGLLWCVHAYSPGAFGPLDHSYYYAPSVSPSPFQVLEHFKTTGGKDVWMEQKKLHCSLLPYEVCMLVSPGGGLSAMDVDASLALRRAMPELCARLSSGESSALRSSVVLRALQEAREVVLRDLQGSNVGGFGGPWVYTRCSTSGMRMDETSSDSAKELLTWTGGRWLPRLDESTVCARRFSSEFTALVIHIAENGQSDPRQTTDKDHGCKDVVEERVPAVGQKRKRRMPKNLQPREKIRKTHEGE